MAKDHEIVIVDDEKPLLDLLSHSLENYGYSCHTFLTGEQALAALDSTPCDVLITDITMRGMRGLELTREVKRRRPEIVVIVMTGFVDDFSYDQAVEAGASDFIKKPFTIPELMMRIKHVKMQEKLRTISITDDLTRLLNRRGFFALAEQQLKVASRAKDAIALLFADLDDFKTINDTWGHQQGDDALIAMADIFRKTLRESDIVARMSGDEFAALLIDADEQNICCVKERLQQSLKAFNDASGAPYRLSISVGMVAYDPDQPRSIDDLLKEADALMYEEKQRKKTRSNEP